MTGDYLDRLSATFRAAASRAGATPEVTLDIAGTIVRLRFAGAAMADATVPALRPVVSPAADDPALTIELWDSESSGVALPSPPWAPDEVGPLGVVPSHESHVAVVDTVTGTLS